MDEFIDLCKFHEEEGGVFNFLCEEDCRKLSKFFEQKTFTAGEKLWTENDPSGFSAIIVSGRVVVKKNTGLKGNRIVVGIYTRGVIVGELSILDDNPRAVTAEASEDVSLLQISKTSFDKLIEEYPEHGTQLLKGMLFSVSKRLKGCYDRLVEVF